MADTIIQYTTGPSGTGKSYIRCGVYLTTDFLVNREGVHYSNFPIGRVPASHTFPPTRPGETFLRRIVTEAARRRKVDPLTLAGRVRRIPPAVMESWRLGLSGPWVYFEGMDLSGAHIAIDECHNFIGRKTQAATRAKWQAWLAEVRHMGATIEFLSQHSRKVADEVADEAGVRITLTSVAEERDPFFGITNGDWYELRAKFLSGQYDRVTRVKVKKEEDEKWTVVADEKFRLSKFYFQFYDSFSKPNLAGKAGRSELKEFEKRSHAGLLWWFFRRHAFRVLPKFGLAGLAVWVCFFGGSTFLLNSWLEVTKRIAEGNGAAVTEADGDAGRESEGVLPPVASPVAEVAGDAFGAEVPGSVQLAGYVPEAELAEVERELAVSRAEAAEAARRAEVLRGAQRRASAVVLLTRERVTLRGGFSYGVGDVVDFGEYAGQRVERINYAMRAVHLDSGDVLRMGAGGVSTVAAPPERDGGGRASVDAGPVRSNAEGGGGAGDGDAAGEAADPFR